MRFRGLDMAAADEIWLLLCACRCVSRYGMLSHQQCSQCIDRGTEITDYCIERQDKGTPKWKLVSTVPGDSKQAIVNDVTEKAECRFRIYAKNEAGIGEVSQPTEYVMIQDPLSPPSPALRSDLLRTAQSTSHRFPAKHSQRP